MADWISSALGFAATAPAKEDEKKTPSAPATPATASPPQANGTPAAKKAPSTKGTSAAGKPKAAGTGGAKKPAGTATKPAGSATGSKPAAKSAPKPVAPGGAKAAEGAKKAAANGVPPVKATSSDSSDKAQSSTQENGTAPAVSSEAKLKAPEEKRPATAGAVKAKEEKKEDKKNANPSETQQEKKAVAPEVKSTTSAIEAKKSTTEDDLDSMAKKKAAATAAAAAAGQDGNKRALATAAPTDGASLAKAGALRRIRVTEALPELVSQAQACVYEPAEFFVAWQGVLAIIYTGIPPSLAKLKAKLSEQFPGLPPENPGSLWPKTSLACLKDDKRLSPEQLATLRDICSKMNFQLVYSPLIHVDTVSMVVYENCCLEKQLLATHIKLQQPEDTTPVSDEQKAYVRKVADEFSAKNLQNYWFHVSKDGNRSKHYRQMKAGATLVHFLGDEVPPSLAVFQKLVEAAMPGMYDWFPQESLHITLRSLC